MQIGVEIVFRFDAIQKGNGLHFGLTRTLRPLSLSLALVHALIFWFDHYYHYLSLYRSSFYSSTPSIRLKKPKFALSVHFYVLLTFLSQSLLSFFSISLP